jgi:hypothetical protein
VETIPLPVEGGSVPVKGELKAPPETQARMVESAAAGQVQGTAIGLGYARRLEGSLHKCVGIDGFARDIIEEVGVVIAKAIPREGRLRQMLERGMVRRILPAPHPMKIPDGVGLGIGSPESRRNKPALEESPQIRGQAVVSPTVAIGARFEDLVPAVVTGTGVFVWVADQKKQVVGRGAKPSRDPVGSTM